MTKPFDFDTLDVLCPMHVVVCNAGKIIHAGPTVFKISPNLVGRPFLDVFDISRPRGLCSIEDLARATHNKLHLKLRAAPHTGLKGVFVSDAFGTEHMVINLSFGISIVDGVRDFALTNADFAATDLAIEMLYLIEAKTAAMEASYRLNTRLQGAKVAAEEQAYTDTLTGLKNRRALGAVLQRFVQDSAAFAVMQIDLDYFKAVNDTLGHAAGDFVLENVARIMTDETRERDMVARVGGDEFTIVLPGVRDEKVLGRIGQRIITRLEEPMQFEGNDCRISASIGTVWVDTGTGHNVDDLLANADVALYASKNAGRATQTFYSPKLRETQTPVAADEGRGRARPQ